MQKNSKKQKISKQKNHKTNEPFRQEPVIHTPPHKDYLPDITQTENESDYREEDDGAPGGPDDYDEDYPENGMQDKKKWAMRWANSSPNRRAILLEWLWVKSWIYYTDFFVFIVPIKRMIFYYSKGINFKSYFHDFFLSTFSLRYRSLSLLESCATLQTWHLEETTWNKRV